MPECERCGSMLRIDGDPHCCGARDDSFIRYNFATTEEQKREIAATIREIFHIPEEEWGRYRIRDCRTQASADGG